MPSPVKIVRIASVKILETGEISVQPDEVDDFYPYVYRTATGVRWDERSASFVSQVPKEWTVAKWFENIVASVEDELGTHLQLSDKTLWVSVSEKDKEEVLESCGADT